MIKVADYIIDFFAKKGIDKAFVVYGAANGDLIDAFTRNNKIKYVTPSISSPSRMTPLLNCRK